MRHHLCGTAAALALLAAPAAADPTDLLCKRPMNRVWKAG
jgi:hypothetical protein